MFEPSETSSGINIQPQLADRMSDVSSVVPVPAALQPYLPFVVSIVGALTILLVGMFVARWLDGVALRAFRARSVDEALARFLASLVRWSVLAMALVAALGAVGIETTSFVALLASAGLAVGLALQGSLAHFASGVMLLLFRPFSIGDVAEIAGKTGAVEEIGLFATTMSTPTGDTITIPNSSITSGVITNHSRTGRRRGTVSIGVAYGSKIEDVVATLERAAKSVELVLDDPGTGVALTDFGASSVNFAVMAWSNTADYLAMMHALKVAVYDHLNAAGIEIPFDQLVVHKP
jgi:small conductance mechanosensitive channel